MSSCWFLRAISAKAEVSAGRAACNFLCKANPSANLRFSFEDLPFAPEVNGIGSVAPDGFGAEPRLRCSEVSVP